MTIATPMSELPVASQRTNRRLVLFLLDRGLARDQWMIMTWAVLLAAAVYASAIATPWLYPTTAQRISAAEAINASPGVVALYGRILDLTSVGELAMTKMTVLYALFVAILCAVVVRRYARGDKESGESPANSLVAGMVEAAGFAILIGALATAANVAAGLPTAGSVAFGASWAGVGLVAATLTAVVHQLASRASGVATAAAIGALFMVRGVADSLSMPSLRWLSPFGWSTQLEAWSSPRWWVLSLYAITAFALGVVACILNARGHGGDQAGYPAEAASRHKVQRPALWSRHHDGTALVIWTMATGGMGAYLGAISPDLGALLDSPHAREVIERLGGRGPLSDVLAGAEFSVLAVAITAFGISVVNRAATQAPPGWAATNRGVHNLGLVIRVLATALLGSTWLLLAAGAMYTAGTVVAGGNATGAFMEAALDHAPAVWVVVALTAVAWSLRPAWAKVGWGLLILFAAIGPFGKMIGLPRWLVDFSPYSRVSLLPGEGVDWITTAGLIASTCTLLAVVLYNRTRSAGRLERRARRARV